MISQEKDVPLSSTGRSDAAAVATSAMRMKSRLIERILLCRC